jgi:hypothetical protein
MKDKNLIRRLRELGNRLEKEKYKGDAAEYWFRANVIELLMDLKKDYKDIGKQLKYLWQTLEENKEPSALDLVENPELRKIAERVSSPKEACATSEDKNDR